jgi:hypothetical protein
MGQYGNQPDFGTRAQTANPGAYPDSPEEANRFTPSALYIGTGGTLVCRVVGGNADGFGSNPLTGFTIFKNIPDGTFFPVVVDAIWYGDGELESTTCSDIIALS